MLPEPYEFLDLGHNESAKLRISKWQLGEAKIAPTNPTNRQRALYMEQQQLTEPPAPGHPIVLTIPVLRVWMKRIDRPSPVAYYDISSKHLQASLLPLLQTPGFQARVFTITGNGTRPMKRYSLEAA